MKNKHNTEYQLLDEINKVEAELKHTKRILPESEERKKISFDFAPVAYCLSDLKGKFIDGNKVVEEITGYRKEELTGKYFLKEMLLSSDQVPKATELLEQNAQGRETGPDEFILKRKDGTQVITEMRTYPVKIKNRTLVFSVANNITYRKKAEEMLREPEDKFRKLAEPSPNIIFIIKSGRIVYASRKCEELLGYKKEEFYSPGFDFLLLIAPEYRDLIKENISKHMKGQEIPPYEFLFITKNGKKIDAIIDTKLIRCGRDTAILGIIKDITERKKAEYRLNLSKVITGNINEALILYDMDGSISFINPAFEKLTGYKSKELTGKSGIEVAKKTLVKQEIEKILIAFRKGLKTDDFLPISTYLKHKCGKEIPVEFTVSFVRGEKGNTVGVVAVITDITERKRAEEEIKKSEIKYECLVEEAGEGIATIDREGRFTFVNKELCEISGYSKDELIGAKFVDFLHPDEKKRILDTFLNAFRNTEARPHLEFRIIHKKGPIIYAHSKPTPLIFDNEIIGFSVIINDITDRKRAEESLQEREAFNFALFQYNPAEIIVVDLDGKVVKSNLAKRKSGNRLPLCGDVMFKDYEADHEIDMYLELMNCIRSGKAKEFPEQKYGDRLMTITISPFPQGAIIIFQDISERKLAEERLKDSREELRNLTVHLQSVREAERTNIAREVHDELGQLLTALKMDISWLEKRLSRSQEPLLKKTRSMSKLTDVILQATKRISSELRPEILDDLGLAAAVEWQANEFQKRMRIECDISIEPQDISVDRDRSTAIFRILQEALTNVARHTKAGRVKVSLRREDGEIKLKVRDNGKGIRKDQISDSKSFGLIGIRERAHFFGGEVEIKGVRNKGTTVSVAIPLCKK